MKGAGCLVDIFTDTKLIKPNRGFNPYTAGTPVDTYHREKQEDKMSDKQINRSVLIKYEGRQREPWYRL